MRSSDASYTERSAVAAAERTGVPFLVHRDEHGDLRIVPLLTGGRVRIGRAAANDLVLAHDPRVSRAHAVIEEAGGGWVVVDDGASRNGTFLNGGRVVRQARLQDHDVLTLGDTRVEFRCPRAAVEDTTLMGGGLPDPRLSPAERRVLVALCRPLLAGDGAAPAGNGEIAAELVVSLPAVKSHIRSLFAKLGVGDLPQNHKRAELARRAIQAGLVSARDL